MLIRGLCEYYDVLERAGRTVDDAFSEVGVSFLAVLDEDGGLLRLVDIRETESDGKRERQVPVRRLFPRRSEVPAIKSNLPEHRPLYLFGLEPNAAGDGFSADGDKAKKSHAAFRAATETFFADMTSPLCRAFLAFARRWDPAAETDNEALKAHLREYASAGYAFCLEGRPNAMLQDEPEVVAAWRARYEKEAAEGETELAVCPVLGERLPVAKLHDKIKGLAGGQPSGCILISYNDKAQESYGRENAQSYNSGISVRAMKKYTFALNALLRSDANKHVFGAMTIVHWATTSAADVYDLLFGASAFGERREDRETDEAVAAALRQIRQGRLPDFAGLGIDGDAEYYVCGLVPNAARIAVRFCLRNSFGRIMDNVRRYHADFAVNESGAPPLSGILKQLVSPVSSDDPPNGLTEKLLDAMLSGARYPQELLAATVRRIKTDNDTDNNRYVKINDTRLGILKACLNRNYCKQEEQITMALNEDNRNTAYTLGRLFAWLEKAQRDAAGGELNRTIRDAYFSSASATPSVVFPRLVDLAQNHLKKLDGGARVNCEKGIFGLLDRLDGGFPRTLSLEEQGMFQVGYAQQRQRFFTKAAGAAQDNDSEK